MNKQQVKKTAVYIRMETKGGYLENREDISPLAAPHLIKDYFNGLAMRIHSLIPKPKVKLNRAELNTRFVSERTWQKVTEAQLAQTKQDLEAQGVEVVE